MVSRTALVCIGSLMAAQLATAQTLELSGTWRDDRGTRYAVRQIGNTVYWSMDRRPEVHNVFYGTIVGSTITGTWADLPGGQLQNSGGLMLRIQSNDRLVKAAEDPMSTYGASVWVRETGGGGGVCDVSGAWRHTTDGATATWTFTPLGGGRYQAQEQGLGNATGTAVLVGTSLRVEWTTSDGGAGVFQWNLDPNCLSGRGTVTFTRGVSGTRGSFIERR